MKPIKLRLRNRWRQIQLNIVILLMAPLLLISCGVTSTITKEVEVTHVVQVTHVVDVTQIVTPIPSLTPTATAIPEIHIFYIDASLGNDHNPGTITAPWKTISKINSRSFLPGDIILLKRGEVWKEPLDFTSSGTATNNIVIGAYGTGSLPVIDGNNNTIPGHDGNPLVTLVGNYIYMEDIEISFSSDTGLLLEGHHNTAYGIYVHHSYRGGIRVSGDYGIVENCTAYYNSVRNEFGVNASTGSTGITAARNPNHAILRHNLVQMTWGIGISTYEANGTIIEDNVSFDNWGPNAYISNATNVLFQRNFMYSTGAINPSNSVQVGIQIGDEIARPVLSDITIINNIVYRTNRNLYCLRGSNHSYTNVLIANNTFVNALEESNVKIREGINWINSRFVNNVVQQDGSLSEILVEDHASGLTFDHNLWSKAPQPVAAGAGDIVGRPLLSEIGSPYVSRYFIPTGLSPVLNAGEPLTVVVDDFNTTARKTNPNIGAFETYIP